MSELKDPKIKLFGKTIELPDTTAPADSVVPVSARCSEPVTEEHSSPDPPCSSSSVLEDSNLNGDKDLELIENLSDPKESDAKERDHSRPMSSDDLKDPSTAQPVTEEESPAAADDDDNNNTGSPKTSMADDDKNEASNCLDKTLKKPDKIIPCPRCNSMDTKFCYFNNYNVNQPRHFCKNCQRYWTAGGSMRNVPVGAGRRKNKNSVSQFRHLTVPEGARLGLANGNHHQPTLNLNGTVLTFSSDGPLCESMASVLNIADKTIQSNHPRNGFHKPEEPGITPLSSSSTSSRVNKDNGGENLSGSSTMSDGAISSHELTSFPMQVPCYPGAPWPYPWSSVPWSPLMPPNTTFRPTTFPIPFYSTPPPPPYWACSVPGAWNVPWIIPPNSSSQSVASSGSGPNPPTLGKHSRDGNTITAESSKEDRSIKESDCEEKSLLVPKTLRIDNPEEAAKSSIWVTLGIKNDAADSVSGSRMFKGFHGQQQQAKGGEKARDSETSTVLQANPAALSRSLSFHESS